MNIAVKYGFKKEMLSIIHDCNRLIKEFTLFCDIGNFTKMDVSSNSLTINVHENANYNIGKAIISSRSRDSRLGVQFVFISFKQPSVLVKFSNLMSIALWLLSKFVLTIDGWPSC